MEWLARNIVLLSRCKTQSKNVRASVKKTLLNKNDIFRSSHVNMSLNQGMVDDTQEGSTNQSEVVETAIFYNVTAIQTTTVSCLRLKFSANPRPKRESDDDGAVR